MKIFFIDGNLEPADSVSYKRFTDVYFKIKEIVGNYEVDIEEVDAGDGVSSNIEKLEEIRKTNKNAVILTNSIFAFSTQYGWDFEENHVDVYLWKDNQFVRIDELTEKELRVAHRLDKMYVAGVFGYGDEV